jgi:hypothetical protein
MGDDQAPPKGKWLATTAAATELHAGASEEPHRAWALSPPVLILAGAA